MNSDHLHCVSPGASKQSTLWWLLKQIKALLIKLGVGNLTTWQITTILLGTYFLWPKLKPNMRLLLNRMHLQILSVRDMFVSKVAAHLIGLTTTGLTLALASRTNTDTDEGPGPLIPSVEMSVESSSRSTTPLSPIGRPPDLALCWRLVQVEPKLEYTAS